MKSLKTIILAAFFGLCLSAYSASAQYSDGSGFKKDAFSQNYGKDTESTKKDSSSLFSFKEYSAGLTHKGPARIGTMFAGSTVLVGGQQIHNRDYWKLPVIYGGMAAGIGAGIHFHNQYKNSGDSKDRTISNIAYAGAALAYWGSLIDGVGCFDRGTYPQAGKATIYSILVPGLGQVYNGEFWKVPLYYGVMGGSIHFYCKNNQNYRRFKRIYNEASSHDPDYHANISEQTALYYRKLYRRYRDYSIVAIGVSYLLQVIDANVFSYMHNLELDDDISLNVNPTTINTGMNGGFACLGMSIGLTF